MPEPSPASPSQAALELGAPPKLTSRQRRKDVTPARVARVTGQGVPCSASRPGVAGTEGKATAAERNGIGGRQEMQEAYSVPGSRCPAYVVHAVSAVCCAGF